MKRSGQSFVYKIPFLERALGLACDVRVPCIQVKSKSLVVNHEQLDFRTI